MKYNNITPYRRQTMGIMSSRSMKKNKKENNRASLGPTQHMDNLRGTNYYDGNPNFVGNNQNFPLSPTTRDKSDNNFLGLGPMGNRTYEPSPTRNDTTDRQRFNSPNKLPWMRDQPQHQSAKDLRRNDSNNYLGMEENIAGFNPLKMSNFSRKYKGKEQKRRDDGYNYQNANFELPTDNNFLQPNQNNLSRRGSYHQNSRQPNNADNNERSRSRRNKHKNMARSLFDFTDVMEDNLYPHVQQNPPNMNLSSSVPPPHPHNYNPTLDDVEYQKPEKPKFLSPQNYSRKLSVNQYQTTGNQNQGYQNQAMNYLNNLTQNNVQGAAQGPNSIRGTYYKQNSMRSTHYVNSDQGETQFAETQKSSTQAYSMATTTEANSRRTTFAPNQQITDNFLTNGSNRRETIAGTQGQTIQMFAENNQQVQPQPQQQQLYTIMPQQQPQQQIMAIPPPGIINTGVPVLDPLVSQRNKEYSYDNNKSSFLKRIAEGNFSDPSPGYQDYIKDCGVQIQAAKYLASQIPMNVIRGATPVRVPFTTTCKLFSNFLRH